MNRRGILRLLSTTCALALGGLSIRSTSAAKAIPDRFNAPKALLVTREEGGDFCLANSGPIVWGEPTKAVHSIFFDDGSIWDSTVARSMPETGGWRCGPDAERAEFHREYVADPLRAATLQANRNNNA